MSTAAANPFKGLEPFGPGDVLFGRDSDLILMKDRIFRGRTTLLFAASGVGKTSFLRAKLIPEVERRYGEQFRVCFHSRWGGKDPLQALKASLECDAGVPLRVFFRDAGLPKGASWLVVLDQFEELFQYHTYWPHFRGFRDELSDAINASDAPVSLVFSMREDFLGQLSAFDNRVPDLFGNYYRLKYPDRLQAEEIVRRTCEEGAGIQVYAAGLKSLIEDLSKVEPGPGSGTPAEEIQRDYVLPPHLQLVCQGVWEAEAARFADARKFVFLQDYATRKRGDRKNPARQVLEEFCASRMNALTLEQRRIAARALDYLVTSQGAKMAYELNTLAKHMAVDETLLAAVLEELSRGGRILREWQWQNQRWFELYHDMYALIMFEWKERFAKLQRREDELERRAAVYDRKAIQAEARERRDEALLLWLRALKIRDTKERRRQAGRLVSDLTALARTLRHDGPVTAAAFGASDRIVTVWQVAGGAVPMDDDDVLEDAAGSAQVRSLLQLWNAETGAPVGKAVEIDGAVHALALSRDGAVVATVGDDRLRIAEPAKARVQKRTLPLPKPRPHRPIVASVRFGGSGKTLLIENAGPARRWLSVPMGRAGKIRQSRTYQRLVFDDSGRIAIGQRGSVVDIIDAETCKPLAPSLTTPGRVTALALDGDGGRFFAGLDTGEVLVGDARTGKPASTMLQVRGRIMRIASSPSNTLWTFGSMDDPAAVVPSGRQGFQLRSWDAADGRALDAGRVIHARKLPVRFSRRARYLYLGAKQRVVVFDVGSGDVVEPVWAREPGLQTAWSEDDDYFLSTSSTGNARLWRTAAFRAAAGAPPHLSGVVAAILGPNGRRAATISFAGTVSVWDQDWKTIRDLPHEEHVEKIAFAQDGKSLASLGEKGRLRVWDLEDGTVVAEAKIRADYGSLFFDEAGTSIVVDSYGSVRWWGFAAGERPRVLRGGDNVELSRNGRTLATYAWGGEAVVFWNSADGRKAGQIRHRDGAQLVVLSPDGSLALSAGEDGRAELWQAAGGAPLVELPHPGAVTNAVFSASGHYVATVSEDGFVRVWEAAPGVEVGRFLYAGAVRKLDFSPDESTLVLASTWSLHAYDVGRQLQPRASRQLGGAWADGYRFLDPAAERALVLVSTAPYTYRLDTVRFDSVEADPIAGDVDSLQELWCGRTGLSYEAEDVMPTALVRAPVARAPRRPTKARGGKPAPSPAMEAL